MINEIIFMGRRHISEYVHQCPVPPAILPEFYSAISISDPGAEPPIFPRWVFPILQLQFHGYIPKSLIKGSRNASDKILREDEQRKIESGNIILPTDSGVKKIIAFANSLHADPKRFTLFIASEHGRGRAAAIANFLKCIDPTIKVIGLARNDFIEENKLLARLLAHNYGEMFKEIRRENDTNANSESIVRR